MNPSPQAGIHSHGDYLIHDHPYASDESGAHATLGRYLGYAQTDISATSIKLWDQWVPGVDKKNGDTCPTLNKPGVLQWKVGTAGQPWPTEARTGNPGDWHIENGKIVAIYFLPKGAALEEPPGAEQALASVQDLGGQPAVSTTTPSSTPTSSDTGAASSSSSTPAASTSTSTP